MEYTYLNSLTAINEIDDGLISEAAGKKRRAKWALPAAAAAAVLAVALMAVLIKNPNRNEHSALLPEGPAETENNTYAPTTEPTAAVTYLPYVSASPTEGMQPATDAPNTSAPTEQTTAAPTGGSETAAPNTAAPTYHATAAPTSAPTQTQPQTPEPTPTQPITPSPTPMQTLTPTQPNTPSPTPTPAPTLAPTPTPTTVPEPSSEPTVTPTPAAVEIWFYSLMDFINAVRQHSHYLLEGVDCYYDYDQSNTSFIHTLTSITVDEQTVEYDYRINGVSGGRLEMCWQKSYTSQSQFNSIVNSHDGTWYGDLYVYYMTNTGRYAAVRLDEGHIMSFVYYRTCTEEEMASYCDVIRYSI